MVLRTSLNVRYLSLATRQVLSQPANEIASSSLS